MAFYLVTAKPKKELLAELENKLERKEFEPLKPFGYEVNKALTKARIKDSETAVWEENDYCNPPLAQERAAILDTYFENIQVEEVEKNQGWEKIKNLPFLFTNLN